MGFGAGIWLFLLGVMAAPNLILSKKPEMKEHLDKLTPYQGWGGAVSVLWGLWILLWSLLNVGYGLKYFPVWWIVIVIQGVLLAGVGILLGVGVLKSFVKQPAAQQKMDYMVERLAPLQGKLGLAAMIVGVLGIVLGIIRI